MAQKKLKEYTSKIPPLAVFPRESPFKYEKGGRKKTVDCAAAASFLHQTSKAKEEESSRQRAF